MPQPQTITMKTFRSMDSLSGNLRVEGGSRTRRGVPRLNRRARCISPGGRAGSDAVSGATAGGDASPSDAAAADHKTDADPAKPKAKKAAGTPRKKGKKGKGKKGGNDLVESVWNERATLDGGPELPEHGMAFVDAVNARIDMVKLTDLLLRDKDGRSSKNLLEQLLEMKYGKNARTMELDRPIIDDLPEAIRD